MRRLAVIVLLVVAVGGLSVSADASTLRVRVDPNDSSSNLDIHKVITNLSETTMYLRLKSWDRFKHSEMRDIWGFRLDTVGDGFPDRSVVISRVPRGIVCSAWNDHRRFAHRLATRPDAKSAACHLPRAWFGHIRRAVRFDVGVGSPTGTELDRAPERHEYRGV
jgi:hypothetical protein